MNQRIFVVDDEADLRESICEELRRNGYDCEAAADGRSALAAFHRKKPGLVLLDLLMPETDGWEVVAAVKDDPGLSKVPIVLMSAIPPKATTLQAQGIAATLPKPFTMPELMFVVSRVLGTR